MRENTLKNKIKLKHSYNKKQATIKKKNKNWTFGRRWLRSVQHVRREVKCAVHYTVASFSSVNLERFAFVRVSRLRVRVYIKLKIAFSKKTFFLISVY